MESRPELHPFDRAHRYNRRWPTDRRWWSKNDLKVKPAGTAGIGVPPSATAWPDRQIATSPPLPHAPLATWAVDIPVRLARSPENRVTCAGCPGRVPWNAPVAIKQGGPSDVGRSKNYDAGE